MASSTIFTDRWQAIVLAHHIRVRNLASTGTGQVYQGGPCAAEFGRRLAYRDPYPFRAFPYFVLLSKGMVAKGPPEVYRRVPLALRATLSSERKRRQM